jgi:DNA invertase Pin-like site-specific DNA recombinase
MLKGYARVSSDGQDTAMQIAALKRAGCKVVAEETASGAARREALERLVAGLRPGDQVVVFKVDRLARTLRGLLDVADAIKAAGATLRSITEPIDTSTPIGEAFFQLLGVFAQLERAMIRERCEVGRREALKRGVKFGRPRTLDYDKLTALLNEGHTVAEIARRMPANVESVRWAVRALQSRGGWKSTIIHA